MHTIGPEDSSEQQPRSSAAAAAVKAGAAGVLSDGPSSSSSSSGVQSIQLLTEEMQSTLQRSIDALKETAGISKCTGKLEVIVSRAGPLPSAVVAITSTSLVWFLRLLGWDGG